MYKPWRWPKIKKCAPYQRPGLYILLWSVNFKSPRLIVANYFKFVFLLCNN